MSNPEHSSSRQTILHSRALCFDQERVFTVVHEGLAQTHGEAIRYLEDEAAQRIDQVAIQETADQCDALFGIDRSTTVDKYSIQPQEKALGEGVFVTVLLSDHPRVAREYFISSPDSEGLHLRRDLILVMRRDGRLNTALVEQVETGGDWEGLIVRQQYATNEDLGAAQKLIE